jgi:hypothetical protein
MSEQSKTVIVGGKKLIVYRRTFGMQLRRFTLMEAAQLDPDAIGEGLEALTRNAFHRVVYPSLVACTDGKCPTEQECFDKIPEDDLNAWLQAARELNPDWLPSPDMTEEEEKKSE